MEASPGPGLAFATQITEIENRHKLIKIIKRVNDINATIALDVVQ